MAANAVKLAPSILSADFARLGEIVSETTLGNADYIHVDIMDGQFVPTLTVGPLVVAAIRPHTALPLDVHLMVIEPERLIADFINAGANIVTIHYEACSDLRRGLTRIRDLGARAGVAINPLTPAYLLKDALGDLDLILAMTVNPGFAGQQFMPSVLPKIRELRQMIDASGLSIELEVDGGIKPANVTQVVEAGARVIVSGSGVYATNAPISQAIWDLRERVNRTDIESSPSS